MEHLLLKMGEELVSGFRLYEWDEHVMPGTVVEAELALYCLLRALAYSFP
jgi:hypothetical protein